MESRSKKLLIAVIILITCAVGYGYWRFFVARQYTLQYEALCNPMIERCFVRSCEEDAFGCEPGYYKIMQKLAHDVRRDCGEDVRRCAAAAACLPDEKNCAVQYCTDEAEEGECAEVGLQEETITQ
jgi:hypothetical protein